MKTFTITRMLAIGVTFFSISASAEVKVIGHSNVKDGALSQDVVTRLFLGKQDKFPSGKKVVVIDQEPGEDIRDEFYTKVIKKNPAQLKSYWSRLIFTGQGLPPKRVLDDDEVLELIAENPSLIGYVSGEADVSGVKVLLSMP
jgi:ABC-type phosphate transport system substrate-binding protein